MSYRKRGWNDGSLRLSRLDAATLGTRLPLLWLRGSPQPWERKRETPLLKNAMPAQRTDAHRMSQYQQKPRRIKAYLPLHAVNYFSNSACFLLINQCFVKSATVALYVDRARRCSRRHKIAARRTEAIDISRYSGSSCSVPCRNASAAARISRLRKDSER